MSYDTGGNQGRAGDEPMPEDIRLVQIFVGCVALAVIAGAIGLYYGEGAFGWGAVYGLVCTAATACFALQWGTAP